jgi:hypothetical protein
MDMVEPDQLLLLAVVTTGITALLGVLVIAVRIRRVCEQLSELDALKGSVQAVERNVAENMQLVRRLSDGLPVLPSLGLHFRQMKRDQLQLSEKLRTISSAIDALNGLLQRRDEIKIRQDEKIEEIADASKSLQEWRSRVTAVYSDVGHLFESEPIRELIDQIGPQPASLTAEPSGRSERRMRAPGQKRVRPRRRR